MDEKKVEVLKKDLLSAYKDASAEQREILESLYGKAIFMPADITERIKTFDDARTELNRRAEEGDELAACLLADYESNSDNIKSKETLAYMKLCIIAAALNEGWEPKFTTDEYRWYPWFEFFTQKEIDEMSKENKGRVLGRSGDNASAYAGVADSSTYAASSSSYTYYGARLCFFSQKLAEYAGKKFLDIWADFIWPETGKNVK